MLVARLTSVTVAPGTTAPFWAVTVPFPPPLAVCACAADEHSARAKMVSITTVLTNLMSQHSSSRGTKPTLGARCATATESVLLAVAGGTDSAARQKLNLMEPCITRGARAAMTAPTRALVCGYSGRPVLAAEQAVPGLGLTWTRPKVMSPSMSVKFERL